jgi:predicted PurR-regulated permease PerM
LGDAARVILREHGTAAAATVLGAVNLWVGNAFYWATVAILIPLYTFFFLWNFNDLVGAVRDHLPAAYRPTVVRIAGTIDRAIADFFRGRVLVCLLVGLLTGIGWWIVGVRYSLFLGALAGALSLVPFIRILALPPAIIFAYLNALERDVNWVWPVVLAASVFFLVDFIESCFVTPYITRRSSGLHPVSTVVALLIGGELAGFLGVLLAIPAASTLKSLAQEYLLPEIRALARGPNPPQPDPAPPAPPGNEQRGADA